MLLASAGGKLEAQEMTVAENLGFEFMKMEVT
jgi:hypothetical protein